MVDPATCVRRAVEFPQEVWLQIAEIVFNDENAPSNSFGKPHDGPYSKMDYTIVNETSIALASTCQYLRALLLPTLFHRLQFYLPSDPHAIDFERRAREFISFLKRRPDVRKMVQHLSVWSSVSLPMDDESWRLYKLFSEIAKLLPQLPHLQSIAFYGTSLTPGLLHTIVKLPQSGFEHLTFVDCRWPPYEPDPTGCIHGRDTPPTLSLRTLRIKEGRFLHRWLDPMLSETLEDIDVDYGFPGTYAKSFPNLRRLRTNEIMKSDVPNFKQTLRGCTQVRDLLVENTLWMYNLPDEHLPTLTVLRGNVLNAFLVADRPVEGVELWYPKWQPWSQDPRPTVISQRVVEILGKGTVPLTRLRITTGTYEVYRWTHHDIKHTANYLPSLEMLDVDIVPNTLALCFPHLNRLRNLSKVHFRLPPTAQNLSPNWQQQRICEILVYPSLLKSLKNVSFVEKWEWRNTSLGWKPFDMEN